MFYFVNGLAACDDGEDRRMLITPGGLAVADGRKLALDLRRESVRSGLRQRRRGRRAVIIVMVICQL